MSPENQAPRLGFVGQNGKSKHIPAPQKSVQESSGAPRLGVIQTEKDKLSPSFHAPRLQFVGLNQQQINRPEKLAEKIPSPPTPPPPLSPPTSPRMTASTTRSFKADDICVTYHPFSGKEQVVTSFEDFRRTVSPPRPFNPKPWLPFRSESEFGFAELVQKMHLSNNDIDTLISIIRRVKENESEHFLLRNHLDLNTLWESALEKQAKFKYETVEATYGAKTYSFKLPYRSIKEVATMVLEDEFLGNAIQLDPIRLHKYDAAAERWQRFYDEPLTGNRAWELQDHLPRDARPLLITMYVDKTRLGSFGNVSGYPVMIRFDNFSLNIRNGPGLGGVHLVGWLPIVEDDPAEQDKPEWILFKKDVYHKCIKCILGTVKEEAKWGDWFSCAGKPQRLHPIIHINALDFEEAYVIFV
ncbi:hypothetical protein H0H92_002277 [Tricholoma furcatifolium]|nr:hypothetical protein H0H92_002277 [Tricholoma furcatifolium]